MNNGEGVIRKSMLKKIRSAMVLIAIATLVITSLTYNIVIEKIKNNVISSSEQMGGMTEKMSSESMTSEITGHLIDLAEGNADLADSIFKDFERNVELIAYAASTAYDKADSYPAMDVPLPDAANDGKLSMQLLFSENTDQNDERIIREKSILGNTQDVLMSVNENNDNMVSDYIGTETGIMLQADYISAKKFDENGNILPYEATTRPWYVGAKETGKPFYTPVTQDAHTSRVGIMCGVPIISGGEFKGVAGAGMYLDNVGELVESVDIGETGDAMMINHDGQIIFSTRKEGTLVAEVGGADLRNSGNPSLALTVNKAIAGEKGVDAMNIDGKGYYVAYAPMETIGWSFLILLSKDEVDTPTNNLVGNINEIKGKTIDDTNSGIKQAYVLLAGIILLVGLIVALVAYRLSNRIVRPINTLTDSVRALEGDNLDFQCNVKTGDETEVLALSFKSLTERIKDYIDEVQTITAEKERIGAELNVATQIQADMLPCIFPAFPDRDEFDIFASMTPAKEVGGDFYDFFLLDDDHLAMVMADVSGKGVPAALFMVISKTLIKDQAQMCRSPKTILEEVNNKLIESNAEGMFVTVWLGILEISTGKIIASNAGHEYPAMRKANGEFELIKDKHGMMVGAMPGVKYTDYEMELEKGGCLFVYTDGVPEATDANCQLFGTDRMIDALNMEPLASPEALLKNVKDATDEFIGDAPQFDDLTMLAVTLR
ncbi:MAG: SpoIIE family protein phosphatase [Lachnospiraceae bacterium]|nr:SpoIIE family protein phosphatase [Lachnospiraceae bacterium]